MMRQVLPLKITIIHAALTNSRFYTVECILNTTVAEDNPSARASEIEHTGSLPVRPETPGGIIFVPAMQAKAISMKKFIPVFSCLALVHLGGCIKHDALVVERKHWLLVNKRWQLSGMVVKTSNGTPTNEYDSLPSFRKDDYFLFKPDSTYEFNDNRDTVPGKNSRILDAGTWKLDQKETVLDMHSDQFNTTYNPARILELNSSKLSLERTHPGDGTVTVTTYKPL